MNEFFAGVLAAMLALLPGGTSPPAGYSGYLDADYVYAAPLSAGRVASVAVVEGQVIAADDLLFALDDSQQEALLTAAQARVEAARATLENLVTGSRVEEIAVIRANLGKAQSDLALAQSNLTRSEKLLASGTVAAVQVERDRTSLAAATAQVAQLTAQVRVAELPARNAQQVAAEANLAAAEADAGRAALDLKERRVMAPVGGTVDRVFYAPGEIVMAGAPFVSILPAGALTARFFVPEVERSALAVGQVVSVDCDSCAPLTATVTHLASAPQTTPPVIYSREERSRLVYLAEARLDSPGTLRPGQPVTVVP